MKNPLILPELREFLSRNDEKSLREFCLESHPADVAELLSALEPAEVWRVLASLPLANRAEIFSNLGEEEQADIAETIRRDELAALVSEMPPDDRVDLLKRIPEHRREALLPAIAQAEREDIRKLSAYPEGTAGSAITTDYAMLPPNLTAGEAIARLRQVAPDKETIYYAYVVDDDRKLLGFISLKDLILARPEARLEDMMHRELIAANVMDDQEDAARKIQKYDLLALPVINGEDKLVGIITQEQTEDIEKLMAIGGSHEAWAYLRTPAWVHFKNRAYWIVGLAALGLVSGMIIQSYEATLMHMLILALYMPMLADTGGNTGSQSATVVVRALALKEVVPRDVIKVMGKELQISLLLAAVLGILSWGKVMFISMGATIPAGFSLSKIGFAIAVALSIQVVTSTLIGALLPLAAAKMKFDPAVVASPALTTIVDITGLLIYFSTAKMMLGI